MPPSGPAPSRNNPALVIALIVSILVAIGAAGYGFMQSQSTATTTTSTSSSGSTATSATYGVEIYTHVSVDTSRTSSDADNGGFTYLQAHDDELDYCSKFDTENDGATSADLLSDAIYGEISSRVGASNVVDVTTELDDKMSIDGGLLTDLCNYNGEIYALVLSSDLQTMTPYHLGTDSSGESDFRAYAPILTPGGYGNLYFDHIPNRVVFLTGHYPDTNVMSWEYYVLDPAEGASDLIESCTRDGSGGTVELECDREYTP